jgi:hypothetical protein
MSWISRNAGASEEAIREAEVALQAAFSPDYRAVLRAADGGDARTFRGENLCLFGTRDLATINAAAAIDEFLPGWVIFASDLGGKSYLIRRNADRPGVASCFDEDFGEKGLRTEATSATNLLERLGLWPIT